MKKRVWAILGLGVALWACVVGTATAAKPDAESVLQSLKEGNVRFASGKPAHPNSSAERIRLASRTNQGDFALATIVSCSDSRAPVEYIFDQGVMDSFILINRSIEENVWRGIEQLFLQSAAILEKVKSGKVTVVGALYELETGIVKWLPQEKVAVLLEQAEASPERSVEAMASSEGHGAVAKKEGEPTANEESAETPPKEEALSTSPSHHE